MVEEICGANCGNCPSGAWITDSLNRKYSDVIGVSIHSYSVADAMYFAGCGSIDSLINTQGGAPFGDVDRMKFPVTNSPLFMLFNYMQKWDSVVQVRLAVTPKLTVAITPLWTAATRSISAQVDVHMLSTLAASDYRVCLYVVEDSVTGTGTGYDQENFYDSSPPGNPFIGMGNPIVGYVHRNVVRTSLPSPLGQTGVLPSSPLAGQDYSTVINYTLPASINENRTSLVAFVYKYNPSGANNEILNAEKVSLISSTSGIEKITSEDLAIYPNPTASKIFLKEKSNYRLYDSTGREVLAGNSTQIDLTELVNGIYFLSITGRREGVYKIVKL